MARIQRDYSNNGFYGIGIMHGKHDHNIGTLWRSAYIMGASFIFTLGRAYKPQTSDVVSTWTRIPLFHYASRFFTMTTLMILKNTCRIARA